MKTSIVKAILISLTMGWGAFCPISANAQDFGLRGLFGKGDDSGFVNSEDAASTDGYLQDFDGYELGLFDRGLDLDFEDLSIQGFGDSSGDITFQSFGSSGEDAPLGEGLLILMMAGAGYATIKKKKSINQL